MKLYLAFFIAIYSCLSLRGMELYEWQQPLSEIKIIRISIENTTVVPLFLVCELGAVSRKESINGGRFRKRFKGIQFSEEKINSTQNNVIYPIGNVYIACNNKGNLEKLLKIGINISLMNKQITAAASYQRIDNAGKEDFIVGKIERDISQEFQESYYAEKFAVVIKLTFNQDLLNILKSREKQETIASLESKIDLFAGEYQSRKKGKGEIMNYKKVTG